MPGPGGRGATKTPPPLGTSVFLYPIDDSKTRHSSELAGIVGDERQPVRQGGGGDHAIIAPDHGSLALEPSPDLRIDIGALGIEVEDPKWRDEMPPRVEPAIRVLGLSTTRP